MNAVLTIRQGGFPRCFSSADQYRVWRLSAQLVKPGDSRYCTDCTPEYQKEMIHQQRCAHPGTTFHMASDGFLDGVRPGCRPPRRKKEGK